MEKKNLLFLPSNMAAVQNLYIVDKGKNFLSLIEICADPLNRVKNNQKT